MNHNHQKHAEIKNADRYTHPLQQPPGSTDPFARASIGPKRESVLSHEQIAGRAYRIWQQQGSQPNREVETWLTAEAQLKDKK